MTTLIIKSTKRLVGRAAVEFVQSFTPIKGEVYLQLKDRRVSAKSLLGVLSTGINENDLLTIEVMNEQDVDAVIKILDGFKELD